MTTTRDKMLGTRGKRRYAMIKGPDDAAIWIRSLSEGERASLEEQNGKDPKRARARVIAAAVVNGPEGLPVFGEDDLAALEEIDAAWTLALLGPITEHWHNTLSLEDQVKNFATTPVDASQSY